MSQNYSVLPYTMKISIFSFKKWMWHEIIGWHHCINAHEFEKAQGDGEGQGNLENCSPWGHKASYTTERLNNNNVTINLYQQNSFLRL